MYSSDGIEFYWPFEKRQSRNVDEPLAVPWRKCNTTAQTGAINRPWIFASKNCRKEKKENPITRFELQSRSCRWRWARSQREASKFYIRTVRRKWETTEAEPGKLGARRRASALRLAKLAFSLFFIIDFVCLVRALLTERLPHTLDVVERRVAESNEPQLEYIFKDNNSFCFVWLIRFASRPASQCHTQLSAGPSTVRRRSFVQVHRDGHPAHMRPGNR